MLPMTFTTRKASWEIERVPNWRGWMWAVPYGNTRHGFETFWRIGPLHIKRWTERRAPDGGSQ